MLINNHDLFDKSHPTNVYRNLPATTNQQQYHTIQTPNYVKWPRTNIQVSATQLSGPTHISKIHDGLRYTVTPSNNWNENSQFYTVLSITLSWVLKTRNQHLSGPIGTRPSSHRPTRTHSTLITHNTSYTILEHTTLLYTRLSHMRH